MRYLQALGLAAVAAVAVFTFYPVGQAKEEVFAYHEIQPAQPTSTGSKVEVVEMFWYGCPHCYQFEPIVSAWRARLPKNVEFVRVPAIFNPQWELHARAYYTAEVLGVLEQVHQPLFDAIHKEHKRLDNEAALADFFAAHGVKKEDFSRTFHSFGVNSKVNWAQHLTQAYGIDGVPTLIVQGKYRTSASLAGGHQEVLEVVDGLIARER